MELKESPEKLPINVVTDFVSDGWNEVGKIKSEIEAVKSFSGSKEVAEILQNLADAYLVCIGQLEAFLQDKKYIKEVDELKEAVDIHINDNEVTVIDTATDTAEVIPLKVEEDSDEVENNKPEPVVVKPEPEVAKETPVLHDTFEYFVDFDEPVEAEPITDAEIEQLQKANR